MKKYECRIEFIKLVTGKSNEEQILEALNSFGIERWWYVPQIVTEQVYINWQGWKDCNTIKLLEFSEEVK